MKIIEAMKKLKVIEKRMDHNNVKIQEYASYISTEKLPFGDEETQKEEVNKLLQSNKDLMNEYLKLKQAIERTNLSIEVNLDGQVYTISELLILKRKMCQKMLMTYESLHTKHSEMRLRNASPIGGERPIVGRLYDESTKNEGLRKWSDLYENIDSRLEVINATTDIIETWVVLLFND